MNRTATPKRKRQTQRAADPRVVGGRYRSGYSGSEYTVLSIGFDAHGWLEHVTVQDSDGVRTHCTAWDGRRDAVIEAPATVGA